MTQKKYLNPLTTSLRTDRALVNFAHKIGLELGTAFIIGLKSHIQSEVECGSLDIETLHELNRVIDGTILSPENEGENADYANSYHLKKWADAVKKRDDMKCRVCGSYKTIQAHHIKPASLYPELIFDPNNGVTLCKKCHTLAHTDEKNHLMFENIAGFV
jgi:hypothetical protein